MHRTTPAPKAYYATLYNDELHGILGQVRGTIHFFVDDGRIIDYDPAMAPWLTVLGEVGLTETQALMDRLAGGAARIACDRLQEVA